MALSISLKIYTSDRSFPYAEDVGEYLCSRCGKSIDTESNDDGEFPIWMWSENKQICWRFHFRCLAQKPRLIPHVYPHPLGVPLNYQAEVTGRLPQAVKAFIDYMAGADTPPNSWQIELVCAYLSHYINAPCWKWDGPELQQLKDEVETLRSPEEIWRWVGKCLDIGLDPF